jgi:Protein of unknown function (DUF3108)
VGTSPKVRFAFELKGRVMILSPVRKAARCVVRGIVTPAFALAALTTLTPAAGAAEAWPAQVHAIYEVQFNGFNVGTFEFHSNAEGANYQLTGNASLSALAGLFKWQGQTQAAGKINGETAKPASFTMDYKGNSKSGSTRMGFTDDTVTSVLHDPPPKDKPGIVPVTQAHLKGVLDPLTAVMAMSRGTSGNPCGRRLPIYDGKQRFDLMLTYRGQMEVAEARPSGQPGLAHVCRVRYVPIAGHKVDQETRFMAGNNQIEIALRPIPSANVFVPYDVKIPTAAGSARLVAKKITITTGTKQQIALVH